MRASDTWMAALGRLLRWAGFAALLAGMVGCSGPTLAVHKFGFNGWSDGWAEKADLLEYRYGNLSRKLQDGVTDGHPRLGSQSGVTGAMPVGEFLYVRWRVKSTGEVVEHRVDLSDRLPKDMTDHELTFVIDERQLYVYVVTPQRKRTYGEPPVLRTWRSNFAHAYEVYPELKKP